MCTVNKHSIAVNIQLKLQILLKVPHTFGNGLKHKHSYVLKIRISSMCST